MGSLPMIDQAMVLLAVFQVKHFIADFPLQGQYMLRKTERGWSFLLPLLSHCLVHTALTALIVLYVNPQLWWLIVVDFVTHFIMDRLKSGPRYLGRFDNLKEPAFWNCFGIDQMVHHLTSFYIIWKLVTMDPASG